MAAIVRIHRSHEQCMDQIQKATKEFYKEVKKNEKSKKN